MSVMQRNNPVKVALTLRTKITLIIFGLFLFLVFLEIGLRLGGFLLLSVQEHRNLQSIKQKGTYRVLCLGESSTQEEYPLFLEETLNQRNIGVRFSVIDKGMRSTNTPAILSQVESYLVKYHPDAVVAMMGINDQGKHVPFEAATTSKGMLLIRSFRTYKLTRLLWLHILAKVKETGLYKPKEDRRSFGKVQTHFSGIELKKTPAEPISTEESFKKAINLNPKNERAYVGLGQVYKAQGKLADSEQALKKAMNLNPKNDRAYFELGQLYRDQGKFPQAEDLFKKAVELNPKNDNAYVGLGWFYRVQGKSRQPAEESFKKAIDLNPKNDCAYFELGWLYRDQGKLLQAEESFKKAINLNPKNEPAYVGLGQVYRDQGKSLQAKDLFKKSIELNPKNDRTYGAISVLYAEIGKPELAKEYTEKANRLRLGYYPLLTVNNYRKLKQILDKRGIRLVCVQYPMRNVEPLKKIFENDEGVIFVDNESVFKEALKKASYKEYFRDICNGDFGHCTDKGNWLLATNIADVILKEVFRWE